MGRSAAARGIMVHAPQCEEAEGGLEHRDAGEEGPVFNPIRIAPLLQTGHNLGHFPHQVLVLHRAALRRKLNPPCRQPDRLRHHPRHRLAVASGQNVGRG